MMKNIKQGNLLKSALIFTLAFLLSFTALSVFTTGCTTAKAEESKIVDMYLIAGQSNAAGYSTKGTLSETFSNVGYAGAVDFQLTGDKGYVSSNISSFSDYKWQVAAGLGRTSNHIGPEYGIAKAINDEYTGSRKAFIFKSAAGGTSLLDKSSNGSLTYGNWYPRSLWTTEPDPMNSTDPTGVQYYLFVKNFKNVYQTLVANGYTPVVKGMAWMQGEDDLRTPTEYETLLKTFITDIRSDIYGITKDENTLKMPFVIGKIATTFDYYGNTSVPAFNEMQQKVADSMEKVSTIETSDLIINKQDGTVNGTDRYHFNTADAVTLGQRFGASFLEFNKRIDVSLTATKGKVSYEFDLEDNLVFTFKADYNCVLRSFKINGEELVGQVKDDSFVILSPSETYPDGIEVAAVFGDKARYTVTYEDIPSEQGSYVNKAFSCLEGGVLKVKITLKKGYTLVSVKFGDKEMTYNAETGVYEIAPTANGKVVATIEAEGGQAADPGNSGNADGEKTKKGCGGSIEGIAGALSLFVLIGVGVVLSIGRRHKKR